jgi:hypothetical protein
MLACLVTVPLIAIFGKSLPEMARSLLAGRRPVQTAPACGSAGAAPRFAPLSAIDWASAGRSQRALLDRRTGRGQGATPSSRQAMGAMNSGVIPAGYEHAAGTTSAPGLPGGACNEVCTPGPAGARVPSNQRSPQLLAPSADDQFTTIQQRLRQLGATYYLLESWGSQQELYRFYCRIGIGGSRNVTRYFEATDSKPLQAMIQVLEQAETWRAGGPHSGKGARMSMQSGETPQAAEANRAYQQ